MPRSVSDEELLLKKRARRRLIGAIALVTLVIVLLPMFLDSEPRPLNQEINIQIPSQSSQFSSVVAAVPPSSVQGGAKAGPDPGAAESPVPASADREKPAPATESREVQVEKRAPEPERRAAPEKRPVQERAAKAETPAKAESKPAPKAEPKPAPKAESRSSAEAPKEKEREGGSEGFVVQVAAYVDADRAKTLKGRIADNGLRAYTEVIKTAKGDVTRVRVGPFGSKEAAQKAAEELKRIGLSGVVAPKG